MKERPILMSGPNILPILEGRKTQTRRIISPRPHVHWALKDFQPVIAQVTFISCDGFSRTWKCPYGKRGDRLWLREAWRSDFSLDRLNAKQIEKAAIEAGYKAAWAPIQYEADGERRDWVAQFSCVDTKPGRYRHARFMPRWASRILLEITDVRVERLQDISEEDAVAEGVEITDEWTGCAEDLNGSHVKAYRHLWESINGANSWDANPWVWVIAFKRTGNDSSTQ